MNQNPTDFFSAMEKISRENDKALRSLFGKYIKGNFLIEMKHFIMDNLPDMCITVANTIINITTEGLAILVVFGPFFFIFPR